VRKSAQSRRAVSVVSLSSQSVAVQTATTFEGDQMTLQMFEVSFSTEALYFCGLFQVALLIPGN